MKLILSLFLAALLAVAQSVPPAGSKPTLVSVDGSTYSAAPKLYIAPGTGVTLSQSGPVAGVNTVTVNATAAADANQAANLVKAGPTSGADAAPTYRALVAADIPNIGSRWSTSGFEIFDEFVSGATTTGAIGSLGWSSSASITQPVSGEEFGSISLGTGATPGTIRNVTLLASRQLDATKNFTIDWYVKLGTNSDKCTFHAGLRYDAAEATAHGLEIEKEAADTAWYGSATDNTSSTRSSSLGATSTNWTWLRIRRSGSTAYFSINGGAESSVATNLPGAAQPLVPSIWWSNVDSTDCVTYVGAFHMIYSR